MKKPNCNGSFFLNEATGDERTLNLRKRDDCDETCGGGELDSNGALACKEEPLLSWVPGSNHELEGQQQQQLSLVPTAVYSYSGCKSKNITSAVVYIRFVQASIVNRV